MRASARACVLVALAAGCGRLRFSDHDARASRDDGGRDDGGRDGDIADAARDAAMPDASFGLVVRYPMDDDPQLGTLTAEPASYSVSCGSACPHATTGRIGGGYAFAGGGWIPLGHPELASSAPFTIAMWIHAPDSQNDYMGVLAKPVALDGNRDVLAFGVLTDGTAWYESASGTATQTISTVVNIRGAWHHLAARWDGTTRALFLDGVQAGSQASGFDDSALDLGLGADFDDGASVLPFTGELDELELFDRALDDAQIAVLAHP